MDALKKALLHMIPMAVLCTIILGVLYALGNTEEVRQAFIPMLSLILGSGAEKFARETPGIPYEGVSMK